MAHRYCSHVWNIFEWADEVDSRDDDEDIFPLLGFGLIDEIEDLAKQAHESQEIDV